MFENRNASRNAFVALVGGTIACTPVYTSNEISVSPDESGIVAVAFRSGATSLRLLDVSLGGLEKGTYALFRMPKGVAPTRTAILDAAAAFSCEPSRMNVAIKWCIVPASLGRDVEGLQISIESESDRLVLEGISLGPYREGTFAIISVEGPGISRPIPLAARAFYSGDCGKPKPELESVTLAD